METGVCINFNVGNLKVKLDEGAYKPERAYETDAGWDLRTRERVIIPARGNATVDTGVHVQIPKNFCGQIWSKSGLNVKLDITATGLIDCGYTGSIIVKLYNNSDEERVIDPGSKITQLVIVPIAMVAGIEVVDEFEDTERGNGGFGSTGK